MVFILLYRIDAYLINGYYSRWDLRMWGPRAVIHIVIVSPKPNGSYDNRMTELMFIPKHREGA